MAAYVVPMSMCRILLLKDEHMSPRVARNPTCAIQQAVLSICCTAWLLHPISFSGVSVQNNQGVEVLHAFFALSQVGYVVTIISIWQRRSILLATGYHPSWAAFTFPFANTAITACLYRRTFPRLGVWLDLLVFYHVIIALFLCGAITAMYVGHGLFMFPTEEVAPTLLEQSEKDLDISGGEAVSVDVDMAESSSCVDICQDDVLPTTIGV